MHHRAQLPSAGVGQHSAEQGIGDGAGRADVGNQVVPGDPLAAGRYRLLDWIRPEPARGAVIAVAGLQTGQADARCAEAQRTVLAAGGRSVEDGHAAGADDLQPAVGRKDHGRVLIDAEAEADFAFGDQPGEPAQPPSQLVEVLIDHAVAKEPQPARHQQPAAERVRRQSEIERVQAFVERAGGLTGGRDHDLALHGRPGAATGDHAPAPPHVAQGRQGGRVAAVGSLQGLRNANLIAAGKIGCTTAANLFDDHRIERRPGGILRKYVHDRNLRRWHAIVDQGVLEPLCAAGVVAGCGKYGEAAAVRAAGQFDQPPIDGPVVAPQGATDDHASPLPGRIGQSCRSERGQGRRRQCANGHPRTASRHALVIGLASVMPHQRSSRTTRKPRLK